MNTLCLTTLAKLYASHLGLKLSTVATYAAKDGKFFKSLEDGAGCTLGKAQRVIDYFDLHWPADLQWPREVPRPRSPKKKEAA